MSPNLRKWHRKAAPIVFVPLLLTALTGMAYRLGTSWLGMSHAVAKPFLVVHQGKFLGDPLVPFYVLLSGVGLLGMIGSGLTLVRWQRLLGPRSSKRPWPWIHRMIAVIVFLPLTISALTGMGYGVGRAWFNLSGPQVRWLIQLHQGAYLGPIGRSLYILLVGLGLLGLLLSGLQLSGLLRRPRRSSDQS